MARRYVHLTRGERERIRLLRLDRWSLSAIAAAICRSKSTIHREVKQHLHHNGYEPERADGRARKVRHMPRRPHKMMVPKIAAYVKEGLAKDWSPEQIAGRIRLDHPHSPIMRISRQCIYDWLARDKKAGGVWYKRLRMGKRRRKRTKGERRVNIAGRKSIELRPVSVESRRRFGDWEADTVEGRLNSGRLATLVERKSLYTVIARMDTRHARCFNAALLSRLDRERWLPLRTITADNGAEFARHGELTEALGVAVYFAQPHRSWQRGTNENTNGLIRQYLPKKTDFRLVSEERVALVERTLNTRPRKKLGYRTPAEVMARRFQRSVVPLVS